MIDTLHQTYPDLSIRRLCDLFAVSRTWYYTQPSPEERLVRDMTLRDAIEQLVLAFSGYGYRRVTKQLQRDGWLVNHKRGLQVMRQESLLCQLKRHFVVTTDSQHHLHRYPNLVAELVVERPDQVWLADITYIRLPTAFVYLACLLDAYSRRCIGWKLSRTMDTQLTLAALDMALVTRQPQPGLIHHSDHGVQYASTEYVARLEGVLARSSMAAVGNPYENATVESFFKTLKGEEVYLNHYRTFEEADANLNIFIEAAY